MSTVEEAPHVATEIASGVYRFGSQRVNWYLVEEGGKLTVVDTGFPSHWQYLLEGLESLSYDLTDIEACILTHAHPDHIGFAQQLREKTEVPVWVHEADLQRAREGGNPPIGGFLMNLWRPGIVRYFIEVARSGGASVQPVTEMEAFTDGAELDVPGRPRVTHVPGHTEGECVFHLTGRDVLLSGDAIVTVDLKTWTGNTPQLMPAWVNVDHEQARASLDRLEPMGNVVLLPGHGDPWTGDMAEAVQLSEAWS